MSSPVIERTEEDLVVNLDYQVLYDDEHLAVVDKPSPLPVHPVGRFTYKSLLSLLERRWENVSSLHLVNRLDSETSGVVLIAKNSEVAGQLGKQFEKKKIHKEYEAIVLGCPKSQEGLIDMSLGFQVERSYKMRIPDPLGQSCQTAYRVLKKQGDYSLLKLIPQTGRTHQLRAHMAYSGHPIVGDKVYIDLEIFDRYVQGGWQDDMLPTVKLSRLALHASLIRFFHPLEKKEMEITSPLPKIFKDFLNDSSL